MDSPHCNEDSSCRKQYLVHWDLKKELVKGICFSSVDFVKSSEKLLANEITKIFFKRWKSNNSFQGVKKPESEIHNLV